MGKAALRLRAIALALSCVVATPAGAQTVEIVVDGTAPGKPLNPVWSYFGYDEVNNTTSQDSKDLLQAITQMMEAQVRVRSHFSLNSGGGSV
jgi:xylan 1,4-beta-xylosidase